MKRIEILNETYEVCNGFYVDVQEDINSFKEIQEHNKNAKTKCTTKCIGFWLYHKDYGTKMYLFGGFDYDFNYKEYKNMYDYITDIEWFMEIYKEKYMESEE